MAQKFDSIGSTINDLFNAGYDYCHKVFVNKNSTNGFTMNSGFTLDSEKKLNGSTNMEYNDSSCGNVEFATNSKDGDENADISLKYTLDQARDGLGVSFTVGCEEKDNSVSCKFDKLTDGLQLSLSSNAIPEVKLNAEYVKHGAALEAELKSNRSNDDTALAGKAAYSFQNYTLGFSGNYNLSQQELVNCGLGFQFKQDSHTVSSTFNLLERNGSIGYHVEMKDDLALAIRANLNGDDSNGIFGLNYKVNPTISLKGKCELGTQNKLSYLIEHKLSNPSLKVNFAHELNLEKCLPTSNWGFGLHFGDY